MAPEESHGGTPLHRLWDGVDRTRSVGSMWAVDLRFVALRSPRTGSVSNKPAYRHA